AERERSVLLALENGPRSIDQLVSDIYVDTPSALHGIARYSVLAHLEMLNEDGRVSTNGDFWSLTDV
ncbi:MAG: MBL fold metallo-hydrolase, partial [Actinomycetota bacterium]